MKNVSNRFAVYMRAVAVALMLAVPTALMTTVEGQGGDPRNPKSTSTPKDSSPAAKTEMPRKPAATKADLVKARVIEIVNLCKAGSYLKVTSYLYLKGREPVGVPADQARAGGERFCASVKANTKNGYYFGKFKTETQQEHELHIWEIYYRGVDTKGEFWALTLHNGKYMLVDRDEMSRGPQ